MAAPLPAEYVAHQAFDTQHGIGWVTCPAHDPARLSQLQLVCGHFKEASNMNCGLALSLHVECWVLKLVVEYKAKGDTHLGAESVKV